MNTLRTREILYETEATLRLVDQGLAGIRDEIPETTPSNVLSIGLSDLPAILERANNQILGVLKRLRETRSLLESTTIEKIASTHEKIREVTSATEDAATNILDACDRATQLVDELDEIDASPDSDRSRAVDIRMNLRDELFMMMGALQFQDITSQQLAHTSAVLVEMESRIVEIAKLFDPSVAPVEADLQTVPAEEARSYDPNATVRDSEARQALADEIFTGIHFPAA